MQDNRRQSAYRRFQFTYRYAGADWSIEIPALSAAEAQERIRVLPFAQFDGESRRSEPAPAVRTPRPTGLAGWFRKAG